jgi:NTE family protein
MTSGTGQIVLALGGGGSRGLAHLGVVRVLEHAGIPIAGIVGTSVGSILGASYGRKPEIEPLIAATLAYLRSDRFRNDSFRRMMFGANDAEQNFLRVIFAQVRRGIRFTGLIRRPSILPGERLREAVREFVGDAGFADLKIPFAVPVLDLRGAREVLLTRGQLVDAVTASCSIPGFFPPVELDGMLLADVGVISSVPVAAARELVPGAAVIAVDLSLELEPIARVERGWDSILRCQSIAGRRLTEVALAGADVILRPKVGEKYWSDFSDLEAIVAAGEAAAGARLADIHALRERRGGAEGRS